jgi:hypothetical protein
MPVPIRCGRRDWEAPPAGTMRETSGSAALRKPFRQDVLNAAERNPDERHNEQDFLLPASSACSEGLTPVAAFLVLGTKAARWNVMAHLHPRTPRLHDHPRGRRDAQIGTTEGLDPERATRSTDMTAECSCRAGQCHHAKLSRIISGPDLPHAPFRYALSEIPSAPGPIQNHRAHRGKQRRKEAIHGHTTGDALSCRIRLTPCSP